jgi:outer membrane protein TolC
MFKPSKTVGAIFLLAASAAAPAHAQKNAPAPTESPLQNQNLLQRLPKDVCKNSDSDRRQNSQECQPNVRIKDRDSVLTLRQALYQADQSNREIKAAKLQAEGSLAGIRGAQAAESVTVSATGSLEKNGTPVIASNSNIFTAGSSTPLSANIQATYNISSAGRNSSRVKAAEGQLEFDNLEVARVTRRVRADVITAYYDLQEADQQLKINKAAVENSERSLRDARLQEQAGLGTKFDVIRAEVQKATAQQDVVRIASQQENASKRLAQILNFTTDVNYIVPKDIATPTEEELKSVDPVGWEISLENSILIAFGNRPELKQTRVRLTIAEEQARVAAAGDKPQVNLVASYGLRKDFQQSIGFSDNYSVGAQVRWDFLDGGAASSSAEQSRAAQGVADTQYITNRDQIRLQVEQTHSTLRSDWLNIRTSTGGLQQAEESLRLARLRFAAGVGTQTDVISAETELTRAKSNRLRAVIGYNRSLSTLKNAVLALKNAVLDKF